MFYKECNDEKLQKALPLRVKPAQLPGGKVDTLVHVIESSSLSELLKYLAYLDIYITMFCKRYICRNQSLK